MGVVGLNTEAMAETVGDGSKIEGVVIGLAMGESEEQARKSWKAMCKDMDDDGNTTIELPEWLDFYKKSLKDAAVDDVLKMLEDMQNTIHNISGANGLIKFSVCSGMLAPTYF